MYGRPIASIHEKTELIFVGSIIKDWMFVKSPKGKEGWVLKEFIGNDPSVLAHIENKKKNFVNEYSKQLTNQKNRRNNSEGLSNISKSEQLDKRTAEHKSNIKTAEIPKANSGNKTNIGLVAIARFDFGIRGNMLLSGGSLKTVKKGDSLIVTEKHGEWLKVPVEENESGWIAEKWVDVKGDLASLPSFKSFADQLTTSESVSTALLRKARDMQQARTFINSLPADCSNSYIFSRKNGTVVVHVLCRKGSDSTSGLIEIKNGIVRQVEEVTTSESHSTDLLSNTRDMQQAQTFIDSLPSACSNSYISSKSDGTVVVHVLCRRGTDSMNGLIEIKNGIVRKIR
jgi:SH3-like domain-containing protein